MLDTIVAFSDSHSNPIPQRLLNVANENKFVFFLGDGINGLGDLLLHKGLHIIKGNCDSCAVKNEEVVQIGGINILLTHGHIYNVKRDLTALYLRAKELDCKVVFYGHTHCASIDEYDGVTLICPGSTFASCNGTPSYVYMTVYNGKFSAKIVNLI